jgi:hypothetical protein
MNMLSHADQQELHSLESQLASLKKTLESSSTSAGPKPGYRARCTAIETRIATLQKLRGDKFSI